MLHAVPGFWVQDPGVPILDSVPGFWMQSLGSDLGPASWIQFLEPDLGPGWPQWGMFSNSVRKWTLVFQKTKECSNCFEKRPQASFHKCHGSTFSKFHFFINSLFLFMLLLLINLSFNASFCPALGLGLLCSWVCGPAWLSRVQGQAQGQVGSVLGAPVDNLLHSINASFVNASLFNASFIIRCLLLMRLF